MKNLKIVVTLILFIFVMMAATSCKPHFQGKHVDENLDHLCDVCEKAMGECTDADKDHKCDYGCDKTFGTHEATEGAHNCQYCDVVISNCDDANKDHNCDVCDKKLSDCADDNKDHNCDVCGKMLSTCEEKYDEGKITTPATCTEKGVKTYTCTVCGGTKTEDVASTGHKDENGDYKCDVCQVPLCTEHQASAPIKENEIPSTCKEFGSYESVVKCSVCGEELSRTTVTLDELAQHTPADAVVEDKIDSTCTAEGSYNSVIYCSVCNEKLDSEAKTIEKKDHSIVTDEAVAATCTETGKTEGKHCSSCNEVFEAQNVTDALGHNFVDGSCANNCGTHYLTLDFAIAEGLEGNDGVYEVKEGTSVTIKAEFDPTCIFVGFEKDGIEGSHEETGDSDTYTFTMPNKPVSYESVYYNATNLVLNSSLVKNGIAVNKSVSTYVESGSGVSYGKYFVTKGCTTDGTYIYAILNAQLGSTAGSGFDIGIVAKFDKNGNFLNVTTEYAFQWGGAPRLSCVDGMIFVTGSAATANSSAYGNTKVYNGKALAFDSNLKLVSDDYTFNYPNAPEGKIVTHLTQRADGYLAVMYDTGLNKGNYSLCIYKENAGQYELVAKNDSPAINRANNGNRWISSINFADDHIYLLYTNTNEIRVKLLDLDGNVILDRGLNSTAETDTGNSNYQGIFEIDGVLYYTIANWSQYTGFGIYKVDRAFSYERAENYNTLTLKNATVEGIEGENGVYTIKRGTVVTVTANTMDPGYIYIGIEKDKVESGFVTYSTTYTFTMPRRAVTLEAVYDLYTAITVETTSTLKHKLVVSKSLSTYTNGGSGKTYSSFFLSKGATTDGTYVYAILNNNTGTNTGYDIGIIAKYDLSGKLIATTEYAFQFGNAPRLAYVDGMLYVTGTNATANSSAYGDTKAYNNKALAFTTDLKLVSDDYTFTYPDAPEGKVVTHLAQGNGYLCVIYDTGMSKGNYVLNIYKKNAEGNYELVAKNDSTAINRDNNSSKWISSVCCSDDFIYFLYTTTNGFQLKVLDYSGSILFNKGLDPKPSVGSKNNYQGLLEINGKTYITMSNWDDTYKGLGIYEISINFTSSRIRENTVTFNTNGAGGTVATQYVLTGGKAVMPETPTYTYTNANGVTYNFVFDGWYYGANEWDFDTNVVMNNITLRARWTMDDSFFAVKENASERAEDTTIRAMSFNVLCDDYNNKPAVSPRAPKVINTILRYMPDVIGLQECDDEWYAALAGDATLSAKYKFVNYDTTSQNKVNGYTNYSTIMYNTEVLELVEWTQRHLDPVCGNYQCRNLTIAVFKIKESGKQFIFTSTHWALSVGERLEQAENMKAVIDAWKAKYPDTPFMMSGDYNANDSEISIITLMEQNDLNDSKNAKVTGTVCRTGHISNGMLTVSRDPAIPSHWILGRESVTSTQLKTIECIDHILISEGVESLYYDTIHDDEALDASDHMPIYCDLKF